MSTQTPTAQAVQQCYERRRAYLEKNKIEAYRLVCSGENGLGATIDIYGENAVVHLFDPLSEEILLELAEGVKEVLGITDFFYKNRTKDHSLILPQSPHKEVLVHEYGAAFHINLSDYLDTGLFLDHRETRQWVAAQSKGAVVLNTFAYTGSFSIHAGLAGARKTYSVDLSRTYCEWIKKNLTLNNLPLEDHWTYKMDTLEFFRYAKRKGLLFDSIIIDPPTFSRNKGMSFSVQKDHPALINGALEVLSPKGFILFSNNYIDFRLARDRINSTHIEQKLDTIPPDFADSAPHSCYIIRA